METITQREEGKQAKSVRQAESTGRQKSGWQTNTTGQTTQSDESWSFSGISISMPEKVFFSKDPAAYIVKNDFYITITGNIPDQNRSCLSADECTNKQTAAVHRGETYPTIYIKGFERLFDDGLTRHDQMEAFFKMFHTNGNKDWEISYGKFRDTEETCAVITAAAFFLQPNFTVGFQLSDKCAFTGIPEDTSPIALDVFLDDFDTLFAGLESRIRCTLRLERGYAVYIERLGAYMMSDPERSVAAVSKGESCYISWRIEQNEKASAFLYDENGTVVANLPPYAVKIDQDRRFMLLAYNDYCSVQQSVTVYRTLWRKVQEEPSGIPKTDQAGRFKIYQNYNDSYFLYVHPKLYVSEDCTVWKVYAENTIEVTGYSFYSSTFSEDKFCVCYLDEKKIIFCEMAWDSRTWSSCVWHRSGLTGVYALLSDPRETKIVFTSQDGLGIYELKGGTLINGQYIDAPQNTQVLSADVLADGRKSYVAMVCDNGRVYFYDLDDDFRNNIFECPKTPDDNIWLVKSNAVYILLNGYVFEANDREKFMDMHYVPEFAKQTRPAVGTFNNEVIRGFFWKDGHVESWNYKY